MDPVADHLNELDRLLDSLVDQGLTADEHRRLAELLRDDPAACRHYVRFMTLHAQLETKHVPPPSAVPTDRRDSRPSFPVTIHYPLSTVHSSFVGSMLFSYLTAALIVGTGLLIAWAWKLPDQPQTVRHNLPSTFGRGAGGEGGERLDSTLHPVVGRITGMVDCRFAKGSGARTQDSPRPQAGEGQGVRAARVPSPLSLVYLGDKLALSSGLLEITYHTGARVVLQGPVTYEVESPAGGFLSIGKLTARLEKNDKRGTLNAKRPDISSSFIVHRSSFVVRTPTATVTDLGTEFGVEVARSGETTSHVFRGLVRVRAMGTGADKQGVAIVLREGEAVRTEKSVGDGDQHVTLRHVSVNPQMFVRRMARTPKTLDLLDIVAGGYGTGHRRERGIDPSTGMEDPVFLPGWRSGERQYRQVSWHKFIDGVFVPSGGKGPVVVDSAGHAFDGFPRAVGDTWGSIWARAAEVPARAIANRQAKDHSYWIYSMGRGKQFMPNDFGLLGMQSNMGITFNLEAMRAKYRGVRPARFRAVAGVPDAHGFMPPDAVQVVDIWVLVDGGPRLSRSNLRPKDGAIKVDVALGPKDRFLTLVSAYGGDKRNYDWVVFGDPVLEMVSTDEEQGVSPDRKETP